MPTPRDEQHIKIVTEGIESTSRLLGLSPPVYGGTPVLTLRKANEAQDMVHAWFKGLGYRDQDMPVMYLPGHEGPMYVLSLEGGGDDIPWPIQVCDALRDKWPAGVFAEPVADWCLGLYPAT